MKIKLVMDELFPVFDWYPHEKGSVEMDAETLERWTKARRAFDELQEELQKLYDAQPWKDKE